MKSSIIQYFGSKQNLFREAVNWTIPVAELIGDNPGQTTENLARGMLAAWAADPNSPMAVLVRASMTSEDAAEILRTHITSHAITSIAETIEVPDARPRAALAGAMLMGVVSQRCLLRMPDPYEVRQRRNLAACHPQRCTP